MTVGLIDSGLGLVPTAGWIRYLQPASDMVLALDPAGAPWGPRPAGFIVDRVLACAEQAVLHGARALVLSCNTASVTALEALRREFEPAIPVIGTVPAVKPAAEAGRPFAVWATRRTTASSYQAELLRRFAAEQTVVQVSCPGLAEAVDSGDAGAVDAAVAEAADRTPAHCRSVVLGCTHYPLVADRIRRVLPPETRLFDTSQAVARQTLRRLRNTARAVPGGGGGVRVLLSGEEGALPPAARAYPLGSALAEGAAVTRDLLLPTRSKARSGDGIRATLHGSPLLEPEDGLLAQHRTGRTW
ncbi:glutamate racemase [Streptomyces sulfonofaciens]|uniref:Glutamate racemase n=1 Tax=Streptomyces sulfonofaciens TaxID=68272 RepID=A0A919KTE4_9ACTN|nr:aspartate/glutamate racemase family protein [Streptomyces sulfonofaciens]GHH71742.1 glutamate racemase [Streptomyces sulfonofaciens]